MADEGSDIAPVGASKFAAHLLNRTMSPRSRAASWFDMVHEFRNHLGLLIAGITELRATVPSSLAANWGHTLADMEASMDLMDSMLTLVEASVDPAVDEGPDGICTAATILERARMMAAPMLGLRTAVKINGRTATAVFRNRGAALECALAALIGYLGRVDLPKMDGDGGHDAPRREIRVGIDGGDDTAACFVLTLETIAGAAPAEASRAPDSSSAGDSPRQQASPREMRGWLISLAESLLAPVGGSVALIERGTGFMVRFSVQ